MDPQIPGRQWTHTGGKSKNSPRLINQYLLHMPQRCSIKLNEGSVSVQLPRKAVMDRYGDECLRADHLDAVSRRCCVFIMRVSTGKVSHRC